MEKDYSEEFKKIVSTANDAIEDFNDFQEDRALSWAGKELARLTSENATLLTRLHQHDVHWQAVAEALGGISCGGVDLPVDDPNGTAGRVVAAVQEISTRAETWRLAHDAIYAEKEDLRREVERHDHCWTNERHQVEVAEAHRQGAEAAREAILAAAVDTWSWDEAIEAIRSMPLPEREG